MLPIRLLHRLTSVLDWILRRDRAEQWLDQEIRDFVAMSAADKVRDGIPPAEARRLARVELGGIEQVKERVRAGRHGGMLDEVVRDARYALRLFGRQRLFTVVIVLTLALGLGANTAIFSVIDGLLLRTLPVKEPNRLAMLVAPDQTTWTYAIWEHIQRQDNAFDGALAWSTYDARLNLAPGGETQIVNGVWTSASTFGTLGVPAALGRVFTADDDRRGGGRDGPVVVISHAFWQRYFGADRNVVGRTLAIERMPFTVVGVTPAGFLGLNVGRSFDVAIPIGSEPLLRGQESRLDRRTSWWLSIFVRLKPGQTLEQGSAIVRTLHPAIREETLPPDMTPETASQYLAEPFSLVSAATGRSGLRTLYERPLMVIMVVVALVLLMACVNIANLLLARATARGHEWSVRLALGASRGRLARQLLVESLMLAALGAAAGLLVAGWGSQLLVGQLSSDTVSLDVRLDSRVMVFTALSTVIAALLFGVVPAWRATRGAPIDAMRDRGRGNSSGGRVSVASGLVVVQVVLAVVLVFGAGLFLRTFSSLVALPLGFERERVLLVDIDARRSAIAPDARAADYDRVLRRVLSVPGVASAGLSVVEPLSGAMWSRLVEVSGSPLPIDMPITGPEGFGHTDASIPKNEPLAAYNAITPGWLTSYGTPLRAGRDITSDDQATSPPVAIVNEAFARKFLNGANPLEQTVRATRSTANMPREIVGVVADAAYRNVREMALPTVYVPLAQYDGDSAPAAPSELTLSVRSHSTAPAALTRSVAAAVSEVSPTLALTFHALDSRVDEMLVEERLLAVLATSFGLLALLMAAVGLYGVTSYSVNLRRTEIGIRMALGATRTAVVRLVLGRVWMLVSVGLAIGVALALWASRFVTVLLFGVAPGDPVTLLASAMVLAGIAFIAGFLPARRASRLDPTQVLSEM